MIIIPANPVVYRGLLTGLRISAVDGTAFIDAVTEGKAVDFKYSKVLETGTATRDQARISAVDGTAFIDSTTGSDLSVAMLANIGKYLKLTDSAGKSIWGFLKAQGAGETLSGIELVTNGGFEGVYVDGLAPNWTKSGTGTLTESATAHGGSAAQSIASTNNCSVYQFVAKTSGRLYYHSVWKKITGVCSHAVRIADSVDGAILDGTSVDADYAALSGYLTANTTANHTIYLGPLVTSSSGTVLFDDLSIQQVTAPSTDGVLIVSTKGGTTFNFETKESGFNYNDVSGYTFTIYDRDITAFADGNHLVEIYPSAGGALGLKGFLKAQGAGEGLAAASNVNNCESSNYDTFDGASAAGFHAAETGETAAQAGTADEIVFAAGELWKTVFAATLTSGQAPLSTYRLSIAGTALDGTGISNHTATAGANSFYRTIVTAATGVTEFRTFAATEYTIATLATTKVTAPSTDGVTIVDSKGGTNYNFTYKNAGFAYNAASYYVIVRKVR